MARGAVRPLALPLAAGLIGQAVIAVIALTPPVLAVSIAPGFDIRASDVGLFTTLLFVVASVSAAVGGALVARLGAIRVSQLSLAAAAVGMALAATGELWLGAVGALLVGVGYGPMTPASSHLLAPITTERNRPFVFSLKQTSIPLGGALAGVLAPALDAEFGWRGACLAVGAVGAATALGFEPLRGRYDRGRDRNASLRPQLLGPLREALARPRLRELSLVSMLFAMVQICLGVYFVTFLVEEAELGLIEAGLALTVAQSAGVAGRVVWGLLAGVLAPPRRLMAGLGALMALCALAALVAGPDWPFAAFVVLGALFGGSAVGWNGLLLSEVVRVTSPAESARATGAVAFFTFAGMMVAPAAFSAVVAAGAGYGTAYALTAIFAVVGAVLMARRERSAG